MIDKYVFRWFYHQLTKAPNLEAFVSWSKLRILLLQYKSYGYAKCHPDRLPALFARIPLR